MADFGFGMEEEFFLVDRRHGGIKSEPPRGFFKAIERDLGARHSRELLGAQIEVATRPHTSPHAARLELLELRTALASAGAQHGIGIIAAGTHPFARPHQQRTTPKPRYVEIVDELGMAALGTARCGLHVHVAVPDPERRVEMMVRLSPFLPLLLALSTSSPFSAGFDTGLLCYRVCANYGLPRTGLPEPMRSREEFEAYVDALVEARIIRDASYVWWDIRPSLNHPTIELRITDCCTDVGDAVAIASLFRCLVRRVAHDRALHADLSPLARGLVEENIWRAQRYGTDGTFLALDSRRAEPFREWLQKVLASVAADAAALGVEGEIARTALIAERGTSAHRQLAFHAAARKAGRPPRGALRDLALWLMEATEAGALDAVPPASAAA